MSPPILLLLAAFLATAVVAPILALHQLDAAYSEQIRLGDAREALGELARDQLSEETALRGYVATRDRYFLQPDGPPDAAFDQRAQALALAVSEAGMPGSVPLVAEIRTSHDRWERQVALPLLHRPGRADALALQTYGKLVTDEMLGYIEQLRAELTADGNRLEHELSQRINLTVVTSALVVTIFAFAAVTLGYARATALRRWQREHSLVDALQETLRVGGTRLPRTEVGFAYASATAEALVGGDLLDSWRDGQGGGWFLIADASGKGIQAARHSAFVQYAIRALVAGDRDPGSVVKRFNELFMDTFRDPGIFVVLLLGRLDASNATLQYTSAGHSTAFIRRGTFVRQLPPTGPIVGMERDSVYLTRSVGLRVGETIVLATDGLTDVRDKSGALLGDEGVASLIATAPLDPQGICDILLDEAERRSAGAIADDLAILAVTLTMREDGEDPAFSTMEAAPRR